MTMKPTTRIRQLREQRGLTGTKLAELLGISPQYYYDLERGARRLNEDIIVKLADILGVSSDYLLGRTDDPTPPEKRNAAVETLAAHRTDDPMADLPEEARRSLLEFQEYIFKKYGKKQNQ